MTKDEIEEIRREATNGWAVECPAIVELCDLALQALQPEEGTIMLPWKDADRISEAICAVLNFCDETPAEQKSAAWTELDEARAVLWRAMDGDESSTAAQLDSREKK